MAKRFVLCLLMGLLLYPLCSFAGSAFGEGVIDKDLKYEGFQIGKDGFVTGYIVNTSDVARRAVKLDMWTTNPQETRIYWRKSITIGELGPKARYLVKEPYEIEVENPARIKVMFRLPHASSFRN